MEIISVYYLWRLLAMKKLAGFIVIVLIIVIAISTYRKRDILDMQQGIAKEIVRFHVRANSDSDSDQALKLKVKDAVITYLEPLLKNSQSLDESMQILSENTTVIHDLAVDTLVANGSDYPVKVYFEESYFPMKSYGDVTFPPGNYEAFRIDIGDSEGKNWWCVLYPPLCFVDATHGTLPDSSKEDLKNILTDDEYNSITCNTSNSVFRFKYLTFLNGIFE